MRTLVPLLMTAFVAVGVVARPWPDDGRVIDDGYERYEVFVPDGSGHLAQRMMTLKEIRALLARQSLEAEQDYQDKTEVLSLEGGKGNVVSPPVESPTHQEEVTDVVSSVKTIVAAEMAKLSPENEDVFVVLATGDQPAAPSSNTSETQIPVKSVPEPAPVEPVVVPVVAEKVETPPEVLESGSEVPEVAEVAPEVVETIPEIDEILPEIAQSVPDVAETIPEVAETVPEVLQTLPGASKSIPGKADSDSQVAETVPGPSKSVPGKVDSDSQVAESVPEAAVTVPEVLDVVPAETTAAKEIPVSPAREKSQAEPVDEPVVPVEVPAAVPVQTADVLEAIQMIPVTEQDQALPDSEVVPAAEETSDDEADEPSVDKTLGIPDSASIVGEIPYFKSTVLSASTPSLEDLTGVTDSDASSSATSIAESTEEVGSEQLSDDTLAEQTDSGAETKESTEAMETSEIPESTESSTEAEVVTEDPEEYGIEIENNIRQRPVFYQNVLPTDDGHHHGNGHHAEHSGHDEQHHHDHHGDEHHHHDDQHDHHEHGHSDDHHGHHGHHDDHHGHHGSATSQVNFDPVPAGNKGLLATNAAQVQELDGLSFASNNMAWKVWNNAIKERSVESNHVFSPLALTSAIGVAFLGARGSSADTIDSVLGLDALTSRNPHLHLRQVAHDLESSDYFSSAMDHTIFVDKNKGPVLDIFKARVDTLYGARIASTHEELTRTVHNLAEKSSTKMSAFLNEDAMKLRSPLGILSTASLRANWPFGQVIDEELQFLNLPSSAQVTARRLVPVAAVQASGVFYAGYDADLDATAAALPLYPARSSIEELYLGKNPDTRTSAALDESGHLSLILLMPGTPSKFQAGGAGVAALESKLAQDPQAWNNLMQNMVPKSLQVQFPQLKSQSSLRLGRALMAVQTPARAEYGSVPAVLAKLFDPDSADFSGIAGSKNLYLVDVNQFVELNVSSVAATEGLDRSSVGSRSEVTCELKRTSSASKSAAAAASTKAQVKPSSTKTGRADDAQQRLVFNRAFLYAVRHNPTGMLLYVGRYVQP